MKKANKGFTLIEVVMAVLLSAILMAIVLSAFRLGYKSEQKSLKRQDLSQRIRIITDRLSWLIRGTYPYIARIGDEDIIFYSGAPDTLGFVTTSVEGYAKGPEDIGGLKWVEISIGSEGLTIRENVYFLEENLDAEAGTAYVFDADVQSIEFEYLDLDREEGTEDWVDSWSTGEKDYLPSAVRVSVVLKHGEESFRMPDIIARIMAEAPRKKGSRKVK